MTARARELTKAAWTSLGGDEATLGTLRFTGEGELPSTFAVTDFASAAVATAALSVAELIGHRHGPLPGVVVDRRLSSFWFRASIHPIGWNLPAVWDPIAGDYAASDGWIRLHTNAPHHRAAAEHVLGRHAGKEDMARAVAGWAKRDLEAAIVAAGGCAAEMRSMAEWAGHDQGRAVATEPLAHIASAEPAAPPQWEVPASRPLAGVRVLDLTRVLAGPVAARFLAGYGAEVLRIDPPDWNEPGVVPEVTLGKRCARLDLKSAEGRGRFESLLADADVMLHGYRPDALGALGYDADRRREISPGLVDVSLSAYGWTGPWAGRRGFDSLVQMSAGIAEAGMRWRRSSRPTPLPAQALDHTTGYLMAAAAIRGLTGRLVHGRGMAARLSLARTAKLLVDHGVGHAVSPLAPEAPADLSPQIEATDWGQAKRLVPPAAIEAAQMHWPSPARALGSAPPDWI